MTIPAYETLDPRATERSFIDLFKDLISSNPNGILGNTIFSAPLQAFQYDTAAATAAAYRKQLYDTYTNPVASDIAYKRIGNMSTQLGIPQVGQNFIKFLYDNIATATIESIIGHHGGQQAQETIINAANAIGAVRSGAIGDLTNLRQLNENNQLGLRFAMDAYKSNFNAYGEIDIGQTHGLTLDQATMISNAVLQDKSQYDAFVKTAKDKNPQLGDEELRKFRNGIGTSEAVASAFSKQIKEFSGGINQFVAAVSKMTGDFEEAINFMQRSTDGKLFDASKEAAKLRKGAVALATNMRIVAADSGMSAQELYLRAGMMSSVFDAAQGRTSAFANMFANKASSTNLGAIGAAAYARWTHANPGATKEQRATAEAGISANIADYGQGDMSKMNVIMARLVDEKQVTKEEAEEIARRGNAEQMYTFLQRKLGGRLNSFLGDGRVLAVWRRNHSRTLAGLDSVALGEGLENEREEKGARNLLNNEFEYIAARAGGAIVDGKAESSTMLDAYTDTGVLQEAGLSTDDAIKFSAEAKKEKWDQATIKKELKTRYGQVDITKLDTAVAKKRAKDVQEELDRLMPDAYTDTEVLQEAGLSPDDAKKFSAEAKKEKWDKDTIKGKLKTRYGQVDITKLDTAVTRKRANVQEELDRLMLDAYTDTEVLQEAGLSPDDAKKFSDQAKKEKWDQATIKKELKTRYGQVDITKLDTAVTRKRAKDVQEELDRLMLDAYTDTGVLQEAGLSTDDAIKFSAKAKKEKWDQDTIIQEAGALGIYVNTQKLSAAASKKVVSLAAASTVLSQSEKAQVKEAQIKAFGREVTEEDKRKANRIVATRELGNKVNELRLKWNSAETEETKTSILSELSGLFKNAYEGANGLSLTSTPEAGAASTVDAVIEKNITFSGELKNSPESQKNVISAIRDAFSSEYTKTGSVDTAWDAAENKAKEFGSVSVNFSREARVKAIRDALEIKTIENVVNKFFSSIVGVPDETKDAARRTALIEIKDRYHQLKKEYPDADSGELIRRAILDQDTPQDANSVPFRQDGFQGFLAENPDVVTHAAGEAYFDTARGLTYSKDANVTLTSEDARKEAASIARDIAKGEDRGAADARHAFSAAQWTEDAANAAIGMRQFTSALADATRVLNNYVPVAHILKGDRRDAEAQNTGLLPTQQLSHLQKQSLINRHGLGSPFVDNINFEAARRAIGERPELSDDTQKNEWIVKNVSAVLKNVSGNGVPTDQDVLKEVERLMGQDFLRYVEKILTTENKDKNKDDPTIKDASQVLAALTAGPTATSNDKTKAVLDQTLRNSGYGNVDPELIAPIKALTEQTIEKAKAKVVELTERNDIDWTDSNDVITAIIETLSPASDGSTQGEETVKTEATTASPSARVAEAATTAEITTPSTSSPRGTSYNSSSDEDTNRPGPWSSLDPRLNSNVKVAGISDDLTDIVNRILTTVTTFRSI